MKFNHRKLIRLAATGGAGLALVQATQAATTILNDWANIGNNQNIPAGYGSNVTATTSQYSVSAGTHGITGTPNITLAWAPNGGGGWQTYTNWNGRGDVIQVDGTSVDQTITFTPSTSTVAVIIESVDFDEWSGGGTVTADWSVMGSMSGPITNGTWTYNGTDLRETVMMDAEGDFGETLTLTINQTGGSGSYFAIDNISFDQNGVPEPSTTLPLLGLLGLGAMALRRRK